MRRVRLRIWREAVLEIVSVTLGILLAFGLDAAWDSCLDGRSERVHLPWPVISSAMSSSSSRL